MPRLKDCPPAPAVCYSCADLGWCPGDTKGVKKMEQVLPTEPGWYFARYEGGAMQCVKVGEDMEVYTVASTKAYKLIYFTWFGKVAMPVEVE